MLGRYVFRKKRYSALASLLDAAGYPLFGIFARKNPAVGPPENVLFVRLDHLGDALMASGAPALLKKRFPAARVTFLTSSAGSAVLKNNPYVDEVLVYDAPWFARGSKESSASFPALVRELRARRFDLGVGLRGDLRENYLLWKAGVGLRTGYGITGGGFFLNREIPYRFGAHESEHTMDLLKAVGISSGQLSKAIYFSGEEERAFSAKLRAWGISPEDRWVGFQIDAGTTSKTWPESHAAELMRLFARGSAGEKIVLVGGDPTRAERLMDAALEAAQAEGAEHFGALNLCGKTSVRELFFLLKHLRAFVGHDSGPSHAAAAMGVPTLFLYSGTNDFEQWRPVAEGVRVLRHPVPCSPCHRTVCPYPDHPCMTGISPKDAAAWLLAGERVAR